MEIGIKVITDRRVALRFEEFPITAHDALLRAISGKTDELASMVRGAVPKRTGKLESEISSHVVDYPNRITGIVGISGAEKGAYGKAAALEYGAHGSTKVRAHMMKLDHLFGKMMAPTRVLVSEYSRQLDISQHDFLRGPLHAMEGGIMEALRGALDEAEKA